MAGQYDAIVVGARCAGAPTAMLLARKGYNVLMVDRASFPSDTLSTHVLHAPAMQALRRWGLHDEVVATGCPPAREAWRGGGREAEVAARAGPPMDTYSFDFGPFTIAGSPQTADCTG